VGKWTSEMDTFVRRGRLG